MLRIPLSAMVLVGLASVGASAQTDVEREGIAMRQRCHRAATVVEAGVPHPEYEGALRSLGGCPFTAAPLLAHQWSAISGPGARFDALVAASSEVRDARIWEAVRAVALDPSRDEVARLSALRIVASYAHEEIWPSLDDLADPPEGHGVGARGDASSHPGPRRLPADIRAQGVEVFRVLAHDPSPRIARAASYLLNLF